MRISDRQQQVAVAQSRIQLFILDVAQEYDLTDAETISAITGTLASIAKHMMKDDDDSGTA